MSQEDRKVAEDRRRLDAEMVPLTLAARVAYLHLTEATQHPQGEEALPHVAGLVAIALAVASALAAMLIFKWVHDLLHDRHEQLLDRYTEIAGRASALFAGSFAIDMILRGVEDWIAFLELTP